jgi:sterol desaturase/sphingolipid hydroxylase (fatty acid hydroxylase superfamily)
MLAAVLWFLASALFVDLAGYWLHRWAHRPRSPLYRPHMTHHVINYPPKAFFSTKYRSSHSDSLTVWFIPFGIVYLAAIFLFDATHPWAMILGGAIVAVFSSYAHDLTHISGSILWRHRWLADIAVRHHLHHFKMGRNFGVLVSWWDGIFGTRRAPDDPSMGGASQRRIRRRVPR